MSMTVKDEIVLVDLFKYMKHEEFKGYDPYDCLNSQMIDAISSRLVKLAFTQLLVYSPVNPRRILGISKQHNPKGLALILGSLVRLKLNGFNVQGMEGSINDLYELLMGYANRRQLVVTALLTVAILALIGPYLLNVDLPHGLVGDWLIDKLALRAS